MKKVLIWLEKIKPDYQTTDNYQHGFHDAIRVVMDKLLSEQNENSACVVGLSDGLGGGEEQLRKAFVAGFMSCWSDYEPKQMDKDHAEVHANGEFDYWTVPPSA
jgi:hypothetical protein